MSVKKLSELIILLRFDGDILKVPLQSFSSQRVRTTESPTRKNLKSVECDTPSVRH